MAHWTEEEVAALRGMQKIATDIMEMAKSLGRTFDSVRLKIRSLKLKAPPSEELVEAAHEFENVALKAEIKDLESKISDFKTGVTIESEWDDEWVGPKEWARAEVDGKKRIDKAVKRGRFKVDFNKGPIAICAISDQHIAKGTPCDFARMREDAELIRDTEGFYAVLGGDGVDNHIKHRAAMISAGSGPDDQRRLFDYYFQLFGVG